MAPVRREWGRDVLNWRGQQVTVGEDGAAWADDRSHLMGSTATMSQLQGGLRTDLQMSEPDVERLTVVNARRALRSF